MNGINGLVLLSHFDVIAGPAIIYSVPNLKDEEMVEYETIPKLIDIVDEENIFVNSIHGLYSLNYFFKEQNENVRGNMNLMLLSIVIKMDPKKIDEDEILLFLRENEQKLKDVVEFIKGNQKFENGGIFNKENKEELFSLMHQLYRDVYTRDIVDIIVRENTDKIVVFGPRLRNPYEIVNVLKKKLKITNNLNLKKRLVVQALKEIEFLPFECQARQSSVCEENRCPVCEFLAIESRGAIFIFEENNFGSEEDFKDLRDYIQNLGLHESLPILFVKIKNTIKETPEDNKKILEFIENVIEVNDIKNPIKLFDVSKDSLDSFVEAIIWLVKQIL